VLLLQNVIRKVLWKKINFARGKTIFKKGDKADGLYIVGNGSVGIFFPTNHEIIEPDITLGPTEIFGEMGVIDTAPRMATAKALEETTVIYCSEKNFEERLAGSDVVIRGVMAILSDRLRELQKRR